MAARLKIIRIPRTPASAFNRQRPVSDLVRNQVQHAHQELHAWWADIGAIDPATIQTEQQAADFLKRVTQVLHPEAAKPAPLPAGRPARSGVSLDGPRASPKRSRKKPAASKARVARPRKPAHGRRR